MNRSRPRIGIGVGITLAVLGACGGGDEPRSADGPPAPSGMEALAPDPSVVADTQLVIDSLGQEFLVITSGRNSPRAVQPRAGADPDRPGVIETLDPSTVAERMAAAQVPWYVLDVRDAEPYVAEGRLEGAALVPLPRLEENVGDLHVRTDQVLLVYDGGEGRAGRAARLLASYGFPVVRVLEGGFPAWRSAGLPVEGAP